MVKFQKSVRRSAHQTNDFGELNVPTVPGSKWYRRALNAKLYQLEPGTLTGTLTMAH